MSGLSSWAVKRRQAWNTWLHTAGFWCLECLVTYGWVLVLIAAVVGVLVFIVSSPASNITFSSSDPAKMMVKAGSVQGSVAEVVLQNITGGGIRVTALSEEGYSGCVIDGNPPTVAVPAGDQITLECDAPADGKGKITLEYTDYAGLPRTVTINASGTGTSTASLTETLRPSGAGSETSINYQYPDSGQHWDKLDDVAPDDDSTYVYAQEGDIDKRDLYELPAPSGSGAINFVRVYFRCKIVDFGGATGSVKPSIKTGTTVTDGTQVEPILYEWETLSQQWNTNPTPPGTNAWTWEDIDDLQIGPVLSAPDNHIRCTWLYAVVDYTPS